MPIQYNIKICLDCQKSVFNCVCRGSSNPWTDLKNKIPENIISDAIAVTTKPQVKKSLAEQLKETATEINKELYKKEANETYAYCIGQCKTIAQSGGFKAYFLKSNLQIHGESMNLLYDLLEKEGFTVTLCINKGYEESDTELTVSWE